MNAKIDIDSIFYDGNISITFKISNTENQFHLGIAILKQKKNESKVNVSSLYGGGCASLCFVTLDDKTKYNLGKGELIQE